MSNPLKEFIFEIIPMKITYLDEEPLKLTEEFVFFHNKSKLRKELTRLQYLFKPYTKNSLLAQGIRDSYLKQEFSDRYCVVLFTPSDNVNETNNIIEKYSDIEINKGCFYLVSSSTYLLLLARDMEGYRSGINIIEEILKQVLEDYFSKKIFEEYIEISSFKLIDCAKSA